MSQRHRSGEAVPLPRAELRAHAHNERHRVKSELHGVAGLVSNGVEPDDVVEPGAAWKPVHHHDVERVMRKATSPNRLKHWKTKDWKRRSALRQRRARAWRDLAESA